MGWTHTRSKIGTVLQKDPNADVTELRRQFRCERAAAYIEELLAGAPPLTDAQRAQLAELLAPVRRGGE
jgi:hypothetical protein